MSTTHSSRHILQKKKKQVRIFSSGMVFTKIVSIEMHSALLASIHQLYPTMYCMYIDPPKRLPNQIKHPLHPFPPPGTTRVPLSPAKQQTAPRYARSPSNVTRICSSIAALGRSNPAAAESNAAVVAAESYTAAAAAEGCTAAAAAAEDCTAAAAEGYTAGGTPAGRKTPKTRRGTRRLPGTCSRSHRTLPSPRAPSRGRRCRRSSCPEGLRCRRRWWRHRSLPWSVLRRAPRAEAGTVSRMASRGPVGYTQDSMQYCQGTYTNINFVRGKCYAILQDL